MWEESHFWQASRHCLLAGRAKQICQLFGQFCRNIIPGFYLSTAQKHSPPSSERFFSRGVGPTVICYPKQGVCTWHGGDNVLSGSPGSRVVARRHHCGSAGRLHTPRQPLAVPPSIRLSVPLVLSSGVPRAPPRPHQSSSRSWQMPSGTYGHLKPLHEAWWEQHILGRGLAGGLVAGGLTRSRAGRGTVRCAQGVLEQPGSATTFKFFHSQSFPSQ